MATIFKGGLLQINQKRSRKRIQDSINRTKKDKDSEKQHPDCAFYTGQIIQHRKRPGIKYLLLSDPIQSYIKRYGSKRKCWKMKLFSIRAGTLGGKIVTRHFDYRLCRDYFVIDSPEINPPSQLTTE